MTKKRKTLEINSIVNNWKILQECSREKKSEVTRYDVECMSCGKTYEGKTIRWIQSENTKRKHICKFDDLSEKDDDLFYASYDTALIPIYKNGFTVDKSQWYWGIDSVGGFPIIGFKVTPNNISVSDIDYIYYDTGDLIDIIDVLECVSSDYIFSIEKNTMIPIKEPIDPFGLSDPNFWEMFWVSQYIFTVYTYYDINMNPLYVGKSKQFFARHDNHWMIDKYMGEVVYLGIRLYVSYGEMNIAEQYWIQKKRPKYNKEDSYFNPDESDCLFIRDCTEECVDKLENIESFWNFLSGVEKIIKY